MGIECFVIGLVEAAFFLLVFYVHFKVDNWREEERVPFECLDCGNWELAGVYPDSDPVGPCARCGGYNFSRVELEEV